MSALSARIGTAIHPVPSFDELDWDCLKDDLALRFTAGDPTAEYLGEIWLALTARDPDGARDALERAIEAGAGDIYAGDQEFADVKATVTALNAKRRNIAT